MMSSPNVAQRLHGDAPLAETARVILQARLDELVEIRASISGPSDSESLHALRISAKRLRYSLEMFAVCFPEKLAQERADGVREMQDVLGRIHDLDVLHSLLEERIMGIEVAARTDAMRAAMSPNDEGQRIDQLSALVQTDGKSDGRLGLYRVVAAKAEERRRLYEQFTALWTHWEDAGFLAGIQASLSDQHAVNPAPVSVT
jgi:hypothetical protein